MSVQFSQAPAPAAALQTYPFVLRDLPFAYDALEPHFDQKTLQVHHRGHHAAYVKKLNETLARQPGLQHLTLAELLANPAAIPEELRSAVQNNGGGHLNHDLFWSVLAPATTQSSAGGLTKAFDEDFGSFAEFQETFSDAAAKHFASGWVALALERRSKKMKIVELKDHEVVASTAMTTLLILDIWEHAYYLKFQNRRAEFIEAFWQVVNWPQVAQRFDHAVARV